jgi:hypothetical protein
MKLEQFDFDTVDMSQEVIEAIVGQTHLVAIWRHEGSEHTVWTFVKTQLPEGFFSLIDTPQFYTEERIPGMNGVRVSVNFGETIEDEVYDNLSEPLSKLLTECARLDYIRT